MSENGSIRCVRCNSGIDEDGDGICPKCKKAKSTYLSFYLSEDLGGSGERGRVSLGLDFNRMKILLQKFRSDTAMKTFNAAEWGLMPESPNSLRLRAAEWVRDVVKAEGSALGPGTKILYEAGAMKAAATTLGPIDLARIETDDIAEILKQMTTLRSTSKATIRSVLKLLWKWARTKRYVMSIPVFPTVRRTDAKSKYALTRSQQLAGIARIPEGLRPIYEFMSLVGGRPGETLTVKIPDVSLERKSVTFRRTWARGEIKENTKTNRPRVFPLTAPALEVVKAALKGRVGDVYLFPAPSGRPYTVYYIWSVWKRFSGFDIPLKDAFRRSWGIRMRNAGVPMHAIQAGYGHASMKTTEIYMDGEVEWARDLLDAAERKVMDMTPALNDRLTKNTPKRGENT
jgi:integrase